MVSVTLPYVYNLIFVFKSMILPVVDYVTVASSEHYILFHRKYIGEIEVSEDLCLVDFSVEITFPCPCLL